MSGSLPLFRFLRWTSSSAPTPQKRSCGGWGGTAIHPISGIFCSVPPNARKFLSCHAHGSSEQQQARREEDCPQACHQRQLRPDRVDARATKHHRLGEGEEVARG